MNARWSAIGATRFRTWTLKTASGASLAKIYASPAHGGGTSYISYLIQDDGQEALFNNTAKELTQHKRLVKEALRARYKLLETVFGGPLLKLAAQVAGSSHLSSDTRRVMLDKLRAALRR